MIRHIFVFGVLVPTIITIVLFLGFLICWFRHDLYEKLFNKQNRPRRFKNSFSVHSVNSAQRIVQYNREEEEYDNEKNDDLCVKREELVGKCEECECNLTDEIEEVTDFILEDIVDDELFKEIMHGQGDNDVKYLSEFDIEDAVGNQYKFDHSKCGETKVDNIKCSVNDRCKVNSPHSKFIINQRCVQPELIGIQMELDRKLKPLLGQSEDNELEEDHSLQNLHGRLSNIAITTETVTEPLETDASHHLSTGLSHVKRYRADLFNTNLDNLDNGEDYGRFISLSEEEPNTIRM